MDIHYLAEQYLRELETGLALPNPIQERKQREEDNSFILLRDRSYFYGHHPRTGEAKWTHDAQLAQIVTSQDAERLAVQLGMIRKMPAPRRGEAHF